MVGQYLISIIAYFILVIAVFIILSIWLGDDYMSKTEDENVGLTLFILVASLCWPVLPVVLLVIVFCCYAPSWIAWINSKANTIKDKYAKKKTEPKGDLDN